jgi:hypothetical protein
MTAISVIPLSAVLPFKCQRFREVPKPGAAHALAELSPPCH